MSPQQMVDEGRVGRFYLTDQAIAKDANNVALILAGCIITYCEYDWLMKAIEYTAYHPDFDRWTGGGPSQHPQYTALVASDADGDPPVRTWRRVSPPQS
ncbi:MAG: hypothetical protein ABL901_00995 [Hyphomicrobiaceae bacterium]